MSVERDGLRREVNCFSLKYAKHLIYTFIGHKASLTVLTNHHNEAFAHPHTFIYMLLLSLHLQ